MWLGVSHLLKPTLESSWARSYVFGTQPRQNVLGTCSWYTSVHITSTVKCSRYPFVQVENGTHLGLRSATCEVILMCTLCADSGLRAKPHPLRTLFSVHERSYLFWMCTKGAIVPRTWFDHVPAGTVLAGTILFRTRSDYKKWCVPRTCSENMFPLELYREQVWTPGMSSRHQLAIEPHLRLSWPTKIKFLSKQHA